MSTFERATQVSPRPDGSFTWSVPDGWQQGRGAWGGLVVGALCRAVEATEPDPGRTLRSVSVQIVGPAVVGVHRVDVRAVRIGGAMSTWSATASSDDGGVVATLVAITGSPRKAETDPDGHWGVLNRPDAPAADEVPVFATERPFPVFMQHVDFRLIRGVPFSGTVEECLGWIEYADPTPMTRSSLLALVDAMWPASLTRLASMPRLATVSFSASLLVDPETVTGPLLSHSFVSGGGDGFTSEQRRLWTADGRLVVDNMQTIVIGA